MIDLLLTNEEDMIHEVSHLPPLGLSHHAGLLFDYRCYTEPAKCQIDKVAYKYYSGNYRDMKQFLRDYDLVSAINNKRAGEAWEIIDAVLREASTRFVPNIKSTIVTHLHHHG